MINLVTCDSNLKGQYEVKFQGSVIGRGKTLEVAMKKASKYI